MDSLKIGVRGVAVALLLATVWAVSTPGTVSAQAQPTEAQIYAGKIAADPSTSGRGHLAIYQELLRKGKTPLDAYRATYIYNMGFELGYYYGVVQVVTKQPPPDKYQPYFAWEAYYKQTAWSQRLWGWFQQGYLDGQTRGFAVAYGKEAGRTDVIPASAAGDFNRYQRSLGIDPDDPWSDLRVREKITGPK